MSLASFFRAGAALIVFVIVAAGLVQAADVASFAPSQVDFTQNESAPRPTPAWVRPFDQGANDPRLAGLITPAGVKVEIVATEPTVVNPVGMTFDAAGTPHVLEWRFAPESEHVTYEVAYQDGTKGTVNRMRKSVRDQLKTLRDANGDGVYDEAALLMDDLEIPSSLLLHDGQVYISSIGHVVRRKPDGQGGWSDEELVRGLCGFHHHQASGLTLSPDGWLFVSSGDDDNRGEGTDGSRATVLRTGAVFRCRPDGTRLHEFARGFRNPYRDVAFDATFNMFHVDNDQEDGSKFQGVRLMHVVDGADYGWRLSGGTICCRTDFERGAVFGEAPGKLPSMLKTGRGAPAGLLIYQGTAFPEFFRGLLIYPDVYRKMVRAYRVERIGATFAVVEQFELMKSDDPLFRPCQAIVGPDGAIYIVDWRTDSGGAGRLWGDGEHGRIYRLTWSGIDEAPAIAPGKLDAWAELATLDVAHLAQKLDSSDGELRKRALQELVGRPESRDALLAIAQDANRPVPARAAAIGGLGQLIDAEVAHALGKLLGHDPEPELRRWSAEVLGRNVSADLADAELLAALAAALEDPHPAVRRSAAISLGQLAGALAESNPARKAAAQALLANWRKAPADDPYLKDGTLRGLEATGAVGVNLLAELALGDDSAAREEAVIGIQALRTRPAVEALHRLLAASEKLTSNQIGRVLETYWNILLEPGIDSAPIQTWLASHADAPAELRLAALTAIARLGGTQGASALPIVLDLLAHPDPQFRLGVIQVVADNQIVGAAGPLVERLSAGDVSRDERLAILRTLTRLRGQELPWGGKSAPGVELVLDQLAALVDSPALAEVRSDLIAALAEVDYSRGFPLAEQLLESNELAEQAAGINILAAEPAHAKRLADRFLSGKLDRALLPEIVAALERHSERGGEKFEQLQREVLRGGLLVALDPGEIARVEKLVRETGNPERGRAVFLDARKSQCVNCHKLEGRGQQVGPDLTRIWDTHTIAKIMESLIDPSKELKEGYAAYTIVTNGGQVYTGLKIAADDKQVVLRDAQGKDIALPRDTIDELEESRNSLMPEGVLAPLSFQEFIDLVAFLKDRAAQEALRAAN